ncbi:3'-5' exonuclease [Nocardia sp. NPDC058640]|uniref:3'-5' exonuclease n=1 Tax=Nocardia sp. NPDC058640 TaxID=3346571 RepID=UPI003662F728
MSSSLLMRATSAIAGRPDVVAVIGDGADRPDLLVIDKRAGLYAIDIAPSETMAQDREPWMRLNRKRAELREVLQSLGAPRVNVALAFVGAAPAAAQSGSGPSRIMLGANDFATADWLDRLPQAPLSDADFAAIVDRLAPAVVFTSHARTGATDPQAADRAAKRLILDAAQSAIALAPITGVAVVAGPPGSGKSLLLAARARELRRAHPGWRVSVVAFNKALVPYLASLINDPLVTVTTVGKFAHQNGFRVAFSDPVQSAKDLRAARKRGIERTVDALLIDELQDFDPSWLGFALDTVRPGRGGALLVGDSAQGLYRDADLEECLRGRNVVRIELTKPYRGTKQILRAGSVLTGQPIVGIDSAPDGQPVDLIWADSPNEQVECLAWEIAAMLDSGQRRPEHIAVLMTQWRGLTRLRAALDAKDIPYEVFEKKYPDAFDITKPTVKVITVHSGKGYEFPVVCLLGIEKLPVATDDESRQQERVGFVGATRAQDQLLITHTESTTHIGRLRTLGPDITQWTWPDDYANRD